jgi:CRP-like cAMP-binding protein
MPLRRNVKVKLIGGVPLFANCSSAELGRIASVADELDVPEGHTIIREGDRGREFFVIASGGVRVTRKGRKLRELGSGEWVGEISLISDMPRTATVVTTAPTRLLVVTDRDFRHVLRQSPSIAIKLLDRLADRLRVIDA